MSDDESQPLLLHRANSSEDEERPSQPGFPNERVNGVQRTQSVPRNNVKNEVPRDSDSDHQRQGSTQTRIKATPRTIFWALVAILLSVLLERVTNLGFVSNFILFVNIDPFDWEAFHAMSALLLFLAINYIMSLIGGWIADSCLGRFKTMVLAYIIYICGFVLLPFISTNSRDSVGNFTVTPEICFDSDDHESGKGAISPFKEKCATVIYLTLTIIAIGNGIMRASICPFGSDQLVRANQNTQLSFFNWFYWCVNVGVFFGCGAMTYLEQQISFYIGYIVLTATLVASCLVFVLGRFCYVSRSPDGSVHMNVFRIIREAFKRRQQRKQMRLEDNRLQADESGTERDDGHVENRTISFLDHAKQRYGGIYDNSLVDDVKKLGMILAVFAVLIPYWIVYFQMQTSFMVQGLHMKLYFHSANKSELSNFTDLNTCSLPHDQPRGNKPQIVAAWLTLFDEIFIILLIPLFDRVIYPRLERAGYPFTFAKRIVLGMVFAIIAMVVAGVVEYYRLNAFWPYPDRPCKNASVTQCIGETEFEAADMSVFWQIPQYALIGISEVFASVASLQFAVSVAPKSMKAIISGLYYLFTGIGGLIGTALLAAASNTNTLFFKSHLTKPNINCRIGCSDDPPEVRHSCHLDYYFYFLAGCEVVGLLVFLCVSRAYGLNTEELVMNPRVRHIALDGGARNDRT